MTKKSVIKSELNKRAQHSDDIVNESLTSSMTEKEIENKLLELNYKARKINNFDVSNHPYLKIEKE